MIGTTYYEAEAPVNIKRFAFINPAGGTGLSDWEFNERFSSTAAVKPERGWHDYETGWHFIGEAADVDLNAYLDRNANPEDRRVFFGEFDLVEQGDLDALIAALPAGPRP